MLITADNDIFGVLRPVLAVLDTMIVILFGLNNILLFVRLSSSNLG